MNPEMSICRKRIRTTSLCIKDLYFIISSVIVYYILLHHHLISTAIATTVPPTLSHILFCIASSNYTYPKREPFLRTWYNMGPTRTLVFADQPIPGFDPTLPPILVSADTSQFPYTYGGGFPGAVRIAHIVKEAVELNEPGVRWFVFGDDDTVFFPENVATTLSKYDPDRWYYIGSNSELLEANMVHSFDMAFGGGGFAISYTLARVLATVVDSCLMRYGHLYGSDDRIFACLVELGVELTHEPGFHQIDLRGSVVGLLATHPLSPMLSLHHVDVIDPIFPGMNRARAFEHLFEAVKADPLRIVQQTVCYDRSNSLTVLVAWGYIVQVLEGGKFLSNLLPRRRTFRPLWWTSHYSGSPYSFSTREYPKDPCKRPVDFFFKRVVSDTENVVSTYYTRYDSSNCSRRSAVLKRLQQVRIFSQKSDFDIAEVKAPRRQCCDVVLSSDKMMVINIRQCGLNELISMET